MLNISVFIYYFHTTCMQLGEIDWGRHLLEMSRRIGDSLLFKELEWPLHKMSEM